MKKHTRVPANLRHTAILTELKHKGHASVADLSEWLSVSDMTIRRDLDLLERDGAIERTHGGAHIPGILQHRALELLEPSLEHRSLSAQGEKKRIAREALSLVTEKHSVVLDIGTTIYELAALITFPTPSIMTSSLPIQRLLADHQIPVSVPCGSLQGREPSISGAQTVAYLHNFIFDISFLGASGLTSEGLYDYSVEDSAVKKVLIKQSKTRVVLVDHTKFGTLSTVRFSALNEIDILITDSEPPAEILHQLHEVGVEIRVV